MDTYYLYREGDEDGYGYVKTLIEDGVISVIWGPRDLAYSFDSEEEARATAERILNNTHVKSLVLFDEASDSPSSLLKTLQEEHGKKEGHQMFAKHMAERTITLPKPEKVLQPAIDTEALRTQVREKKVALDIATKELYRPHRADEPADRIAQVISEAEANLDLGEAYVALSRAIILNTRRRYIN